MVYYYTGIYYPEHEEEYKKATRDIEIMNIYGSINGYAISPLHSADCVMSKPHYHIILQSTKQLTKNTLDSMSNWLVRISPVSNINSMYNYLTHKGFDDKEQFADDIKPQCFGRFDINLGDNDNVIKDLLIYAGDCVSMSELTMRLMMDENYVALKYLSSHAYYFNLLLKQNLENSKKSLDFE